VKQILLVSGVDYEFKGVDFRELANNRRKFLLKKNTKHEDVRFTTMDVRAGEVEQREVTFPGGKRTETVTSSKTFDPVGKASYDMTGGHPTFKPKQYKVMSITDVYAKVEDIGNSDPGSLAELSIFSHGWMGGPILVNSYDDRRMEISIPVPMAAPVTMTIPVTGTSRDPDDKDGRPQFDFQAPTMDAAKLALFRKAFASDGFAWLWGCAFPRVVHHSMWAMEHAKAYKSSGLGDDVVLDMTQVTTDDIGFLEKLLAPKLGAFPSHTSAKVAFKWMKWAICIANISAYATALATAANVDVRAAALGTYAEYDTGGDRLMNVYPGFTGHFTFYKNYMGFTFDPEGRRYAVYKPGMTCTAPSP
jgi:hypothetical protein